MARRSKAKLPALMLYTGDWKKDPNLCRCSPATRGIWVDLLCSMHDDGRTGKLTGTVEELARMGRCTPAELSAALNEILRTKTAHVTFCNSVVTVKNRRMEREHKARQAMKLRVKRHRMKRECNPPCTGSISSSSSYISYLSPDGGGRVDRKSKAWLLIEPGPQKVPDDILAVFHAVGPCDDHTSLRDTVELAIRRIGYDVQREAPCPIDDDHMGRVDLVARKDPDVLVGIELDRKSPREKSLKKLAHFPCGIVALREAMSARTTGVQHDYTDSDTPPTDPFDRALWDARRRASARGRPDGGNGSGQRSAGGGGPGLDDPGAGLHPGGLGDPAGRDVAAPPAPPADVAADPASA